MRSPPDFYKIAPRMTTLWGLLPNYMGEALWYHERIAEAHEIGCRWFQYSPFVSFIRLEGWIDKPDGVRYLKKIDP